MAAEDADGALSDLGEELVDNAGDEEGNVLGGRLTHRETCLIGRTAPLNEVFQNES